MYWTSCVVTAVLAGAAPLYVVSAYAGEAPAAAPSPAAAPPAAAENPITESHPGMSIEPLYAEAVLAFNAKQMDRALQVLENLLKIAPKHVESLELKALTLKAKGDDVASLKAYSELVKLKPPAEAAAYHFEIGVILFREKKLKEAREQLEKALEHRFNWDTTHFFMGMIAFQLEDRSAAEKHFSQVIADGAGELKVASHFYRGLIYFQTGYGTGGTHELIEARDEAKHLPDSSIAKDILKAANKALEPYDKAQWFGSISLMGQYDGNVSLIPSGNTNVFDTSVERASPKLLVALAAGRMGSPMGTVQAVPSFRLSYNKNFNAQTINFEFLSVTPSLYLTLRPLARTSWGFKVEVPVTLQNSIESLASAGAFPTQLYSVSGDFGPYIRRELAQKVNLNIELFGRYQMFFNLSTETGDTARSGFVALPRVTLKLETGSALFNPTFYVNGEYSNASGKDFRSYSVGGGLANTVRITGKDTVTVSADATYSVFPQRDPVRTDVTYTVRLGYLRPLTGRLSLVADLSYTRNNSSNSDLYSYNKPAALVGLSLNL